MDAKVSLVIVILIFIQIEFKIGCIPWMEKVQSRLFVYDEGGYMGTALWIAVGAAILCAIVAGNKKKK